MNSFNFKRTVGGIGFGMAVIAVGACSGGANGPSDEATSEAQALVVSGSGYTPAPGETLLTTLDVDGNGDLEAAYKFTVRAGVDRLRVASANGTFVDHVVSYDGNWSLMVVDDLDGIAGQELALNVRTATNRFKIQTIGRGSDWEYDPNTAVSTVSWSLMGTADTDGKPGKELILDTLEGVQQFRVVHKSTGLVRSFPFSPGESVRLLNGGIVDVDGRPGAELVVNRQGSTVYVIRDVDNTTSSYAVGNGAWSIVGYSDLNGVAGNEIVIKDADSLRAISDASHASRLFSVGANWAFQQFANTDGQPGNEVVVNVNGQIRSIVWGSDVPVTTPVDTTAGAPISQKSSGMCVHPRGGSPTPVVGTPAVLFADCTVQPRLDLLFTVQGSIRQASSGMCLIPEGAEHAAPTTGTRLVYTTTCNQPVSAFVMKGNGTIVYTPNGMCVEPSGGATHPASETQLVLNTCNGGSAQQFKVAAVTQDGRLQHNAGLCVHPSGGSSSPADGTPTVLWNDCSFLQDRLNYRFLANGSLQQVSSGKCLRPSGGALSPAIETPLVFWDSCGSESGRFELTPSGSLRHISSGMCVNPLHGSATPAVGTPLVLHPSCDEPRLKFILTSTFPQVQ